MFFDRPSSVEGPSKHFHPGSPRIEASLGPGCSGVIRDGPCWVRLWCDLGFRKKAPVDRRSHQRGGDNRQVRRTRASVDNRPIRVWGRFGFLYSPVRGADWSDVLSVGGGPVGKDVWIGYIGDGFSQCQSPDAAPLTELRDLNTLLHIYSDCAKRFYLIWTVCITVRISISVEEVTRCGCDLSECRTMDGAALADDRSGITFTAELCMPWDAPKAVIDINSTDLVSLDHSQIK